MATITLKYDGRNPLAKKVIDFVLSLGIFEKITAIDEALDDVKNGKTKEYDSVDEFFKNLS